jgi:hypothetical protein
MKTSSTAAILFVSLVATFAADVNIRKKELLQHGFAGPITEIAQCGDGTNRQVLILAQGNGVSVDSQWHIEKRFSFESCNETKVLAARDGNCVVYCSGGGFSPVWSMDLQGRELWRYDSRQVARVIPDLEGRYFICTMSQGVRVIDAKGTQIDSFADDLSDICFLNPSLAWAISADGLKRYLERREESFKLAQRTEIAKGAFRLVACHWPETNDVCYATYTHLVCVGADQQEKGRIRFGGTITSINGVTVQGIEGSFYLALVARHKTSDQKSELLVIDRRRKVVYEEELPVSKAISTLGMAHRFYVGVGNTSVVEYQIAKGNPK